MNRKIKNYIVSSADWEFEIDDNDPKSAALSALLFAFSKFGKNLLMSTVVMVNPKDQDINGDINFAEFFPTHELMNDIGLSSISDAFLKLTLELNESKYIKK